ncbi:hypothetical protein [Actinopolyspora alba]|uniref:hypothetical protein n=1 Tax=Actinopolyspora alba TaxID=673379 RepID=UPI000B839A1F|nr:hypothetical protein [Actinopolyspora alba]
MLDRDTTSTRGGSSVGGPQGHRPDRSGGIGMLIEGSSAVVTGRNPMLNGETIRLDGVLRMAPR